jgi:hypothetical protein
MRDRCSTHLQDHQDPILLKKTNCLSPASFQGSKMQLPSKTEETPSICLDHADDFDVDLLAREGTYSFVSQQCGGKPQTYRIITTQSFQGLSLGRASLYPLEG